MMLPELDPGVGVVAELGQVGERRAIALDRQHRAGGEVDPDADHVRRIDAGLAQDCRDRLAENLQVVVGVLERPALGEPDLAVGEWQSRIDHTVDVGMHGGRDLPTVGDVDQDGTPRLGPEVDTDRVLDHASSLFRCHGHRWPSPTEGASLAVQRAVGLTDADSVLERILNVTLAFPLTFTV
jgi:hypothetical protein